jgi:glycosyltransferase involved in cell wall biosynthesis
LVLAGKKDQNYKLIEAKAKEGNLLDGVIFTGFVSEGELRWLYENCSAYIFPSLSEGFGLPGLEAMMHGAPVVSSNATCLPETHGDAAHYFDPLDTEDIAKKISEVLDDIKLRKELIEKGKKQAAKYSWRRMAEQTLAVYNKVLEQ